MIRKRKPLLFGIILLLCITYSSYAQQYPVFTQYYFNELLINPAYAGSQVQLSLTAMYRNQWVNFPGAPRTFNFSGHTSFMKKKMGLGLMINHDEIGSYKNQHVFLSYSYKLHFQKSTLSMGIQAGINLLGADYSSLSLQTQGDQSFINTINTIKPNFGVGVYYNRKNFFAGLSIPFIINNQYGGNIDAQGLLNGIKEARYYFLRSGYVHAINKIVKINPSILIRTQEGQPISADFNAALIFYDVFGAGISYRSSDSFITFIDLQLNEQMHFAYSYDWTTSTLNRFSAGTHEFMLNYRFKISSVHKNLECPRYYDYR